MIHNQTDNGGHFGVALNADKTGVLVQVMEGFGNGTQARELLTPNEARRLADLLYVAANDPQLLKGIAQIEVETCPKCDWPMPDCTCE